VSFCSVIDSMTLTFQSQNHVSSSISQGHAINQVWTRLGLSVFELCCGQTDKQTDSLDGPTHADRHSWHR